MESPWQYSTVHNSACKVIEEQTLWGQTVCRVWFPDKNVVLRVPSKSLRPLYESSDPAQDSHRLNYLAAAARVAEVLAGKPETNQETLLLAPMESNVIPLPHQLRVLSRALSGDRVRYLLADEVGLGKTIEAGLVMRELKLRGKVRRTLVVAPKGLATQWVAEMQTHFNEDFQLVLGDDIGTMQRMAPGNASVEAWRGDKHALKAARNPWTLFEQLIVSLDSVKPLDKRRGWSDARIADYNRSRFEDLMTAGWDLVIVDEAHRMGGSTDLVARYKLGKGLAEAAPYFLLLSATPHQGKSDAFHRLMNLLDDDAFPDEESVTQERVRPYVIRTEKRQAVDADGKALFKPRRTESAAVAWEDRHHLQRLLYEAVTDYVREGYNQALESKQRHIGFLMILMQRLVVSSTQAIRTTLERRLDVLRGESEDAAAQLAADPDLTGQQRIDEFYELDGQELLDMLLRSRLSALANERLHVETLLDVARRSEQAGPDAKAEALLELIYRLQVEENEVDLKLLIFTEFVPTQAMLKEFLAARGIPVVTLNGSMDMDERRQAQDAFRDTHRVLVSTDAGGEGLNLQFAHVVVNYDIPWNPMRLEQRIGRVDRIGQPKTVRAINFVLEDSVEFRVRDVLESKLAVIYEEFGIDKTGDVLDSAQAGELFEDMYASALADPDRLDATVQDAVHQFRNELARSRSDTILTGLSEEMDTSLADRLRSHPLPVWVERMTTSYLLSHGGQVEHRNGRWDLFWPDGVEQRSCVFNVKDAMGRPHANLLSLENGRVRGLAMDLPWCVPGQAIPVIQVRELAAALSGLWGLFELRLRSAHTDVRHAHLNVHTGYFCLFQSDDGKVFLPTARRVWDALVSGGLDVTGCLDETASGQAHRNLMSLAEEYGSDTHDVLLQRMRGKLEGEAARGEQAFAARRRVIRRVGLPEVRDYRLRQLEREESVWQEQMQAAHQVVPELRAVIVARVQSANSTEHLS